MLRHRLVRAGGPRRSDPARPFALMHDRSASGDEEARTDGTSNGGGLRSGETAIWRVASVNDRVDALAAYRRARGTDAVHAAFAVRGFAASALVRDVRAFASSAIPPSLEHQPGVSGGAGGGAPVVPPPSVPPGGGLPKPNVSLKKNAGEKDGSDATSKADEVPVEVDLYALDRAKAEIDRLHRERQIREARGMYESAKAAAVYVASFGPYAVACARMSRAEWRHAVAHGWHHFKDEMSHYWMGTKLLWVEVKIASRLLFKTLRGEQLTRRERRQMTRTTADVFRLVPFAAFVLIPFMEFLLPVALKLFPGMLPSTFRNDLKHEEELKKKLKAKLEVARFLQDTVRVMAKGLKQSRSGYTRDKADKLYDFMKRVRSGDATVTNDDISKFATLFGDEFTLDHISRGQLANMCRFVGIAPYGTDFYLRNQLSQKLRSLKNDDRVIKQDGIASLSLEELKSANRARGMRADTDDRAILERQLEDWLDLSLERKLPPSLLILSRAFTITRERMQPDTAEEEPAPVGAGDVAWDPAVDLDKIAAEERQAVALKEIQETLASLPEEVVVSVTEERNLSSSRKEQVARKLEFLEQEEELIEEEIADRKLEEDELRAKKEAAEKAKAEAAASEKAAASDDRAAAETLFDAHEKPGEKPGERAAAPDAAVAPEAAAASTDPEVTGGSVAKKPKRSFDSIDSVSMDEVESVVAGRRAKRAARLSRLLAALSGLSSLTVERKELAELVRKELDLYGRRLRQVQTQLEGLEEGDAMRVAAAVAAEGDAGLARSIEKEGLTEGLLSRAKKVLGWKEEPKKKDAEEAREKGETAEATSPIVDLTEPPADDDEEERMAEPEELVPDEFGPDVLPPRTTGPGDDGEVLPTASDVIPEEDPAEDEDSNEKPGWFTASYDAYLSDRVNERVNRMLAGVKKDLDAADGVIGDKLKVLDADGDGRVTIDELTAAGGVLADQLDEEDQEELRGLVAELPQDEFGRIGVEDVSALLSDILAREFESGELFEDHHDDEDERVRAREVIDTIRTEGAALVAREGEGGAAEK